MQKQILLSFIREEDTLDCKLYWYPKFIARSLIRWPKIFGTFIKSLLSCTPILKGIFLYTIIEDLVLMSYPLSPE